MTGLVVIHCKCVDIGSLVLRFKFTAVHFAMSFPKRHTRSTAGPVVSPELERLLNNIKNEILSKFETEISSVKSCLKTLSSQMKSLEGRMTSLQEKTEQHDEEIRCINKCVEGLRNGISSSVIEEVMQRVERQQNLVISGLSEKSSEWFDR